MKKKRLARVIIAAVVTTAILVAIIVGCGPKWGDGSANVNGSNSNSSNSASDNVSSNDNAAQSNNNYATRITVKLPSYYLENMVFQRGKTLVVKGTATTSQRGKVVDPTQLITTISQGKELLSDTIKLAVPARTRLAVTFYTPKAIEQTGHWLANETSYITIGTKKTRSPDTKGWIDTPSWWFIDSIDVQASEARATKTIVALGDSLTDGFYSTNEGRYTDTLMNRLNSEKGNEWSLVNEGITGNQVLTDSPTNVAKNTYFGQAALSRIDRDVFNRPGLKDILLLEGINDINTGVSANKIIESYKKIINQAHTSGVRIIAGTLPPFKGYSTWSAKKDKVRQKVNHWILTSGAFDGTVDFAKVLAISGNSEELNPIYDSGDHLHPNNAGYKAMGDAVNLSMFK